MEENLTVKLTTEITDTDRKKITTYNIFRKDKWRTLYLAIFCVLCVALLVVHILNVVNIPLFLVITSVVLLLFIISLFVMVRFFPLSASAPTYRELTIDERGICTAFSHGPVVKSWQDIITIRELSDYILVYFNLVDTLILPKRCFAPGDLEKTKAIIKGSAAAVVSELK